MTKKEYRKYVREQCNAYYNKITEDNKANASDDYKKIVQKGKQFIDQSFLDYWDNECYFSASDFHKYSLISSIRIMEMLANDADPLEIKKELEEIKTNAGDRGEMAILNVNCCIKSFSPYRDTYDYIINGSSVKKLCKSFIKK